MPCLPAETDLYPQSLFELWTEDQSERRWWAIYTKARQEKALARQLLGHEIPFYLPLIGQHRVVRGRRIRSYMPVFSGYLFLYGSDEERVQALTTNRISQTLHVDDQTLLARDLSRLRRLIESNAPVTIEQRLTVGDRVRVKSGPVQGMEGIVISRRGRTRLLVAVTFLQQGASIEIDDFQLEPLY